MTSIAVIDKYPIIRIGLGIYLRNHFKGIDIFESDSLDQFRRYYANENPDLFILGYTHDQKVTHYQQMTQFREEHPAAKIIIYDDEPYFTKVELYLKAGITGYISKKSDMPELLKCISEVQNGKIYLSNEVMEVLLPKWLSSTGKPHPKHAGVLTRHEFEIATSLVNGDNITSIAKKLARRTSTISAIKKTIFKKLEVDNAMDLKRALIRASVKPNI